MLVNKKVTHFKKWSSFFGPPCTEQLSMNTAMKETSKIWQLQLLKS